MRKLFLTLVACMVAIAANAWSVKFTNPDNWSNVYVYVFGSNAAGPAASWPGAQMTKSGDVWTYEYSGTAPASIIFNAGNNQPQTGDLTFGAANDGKTFDKSGPLGATLNDYSVYFDNSTAKWANVFAYCWDGVSTAGWPGDKVTKTDNRGYYVFEYKAASAPSANAKIIWNNGAGVQTGNLTYTPGEVYDQNGPVNATEETYTVYCNNTAGWDQVWVYTFSPELAGSWPGTQLTANSQGIYEWNYVSKVKPECEGIIFNNGGNGKQTDNLIYEVGHTYTNGDSGSEIWVNLNGDFHPDADNGVQPSAEGIASWTNQAIGAYPVYVKVWDGADKYYYSATPVEVGTWTALTSVDEGTATYIKGQTANCVFNVEYNIENNNIKFELVSGDLETEPEVPGYPEKMYLIGTFNGEGWNATSGVEMVNEGDGFYTVEDVVMKEVDGNTGFAFVTDLAEVNDQGGWDYINARRYGPAVNDTEATLETELEMKKNANSWSIQPGTYSFYISLDDMILEIEGTPDEEPAFTELYLRGTMTNEWAAEDDWKFETEDGVNYTLEGVDIPLDAQFKIADEDWNVSYTIENGGTVKPNEDYTLGNFVGDNTNMTMGIGVTDATVTFNSTTGAFKIAATIVMPDVTIPEKLYMLGNINNLNWSTSKGVAADNEEGVFTFSNVEVNAAGSDNNNGYFNFVTKLGEDWNAVNGSDRFGAPAENTPVELGDAMEVAYYPVNISASGSQSWMLAAGNYDMVVDLNEMTLTVTEAQTAVATFKFNAMDGVEDAYEKVGIEDLTNETFLSITGETLEVSTETTNMYRVYAYELDYDIRVSVEGVDNEDDEAYTIVKEEDGYYLTLFPAAAGAIINVDVYLEGNAPKDDDSFEEVELSISINTEEAPKAALTISYFDRTTFQEVPVEIVDNEATFTVNAGTTITLTPDEGYKIANIIETLALNETFSISAPATDDPNGPWMISISDTPAEGTADLQVIMDYSDPVYPEGENYVWFDDPTAPYVAGNTESVEIELPVKLDMEAAPFTYAGFQFDLQLPEWLSVTGAALGTGLPTESIRFNTVADQENTYRVIAFFPNAAGYEVTKAIADLTLTVDRANETFQIGRFPMVITNPVIFSTPGGSDLEISGYDGFITVIDATDYITSLEVSSATLVEPSYSNAEDKDMIEAFTVGEQVLIVVDVTYSDNNNDGISDTTDEPVKVTVNGEESDEIEALESDNENELWFVFIPSAAGDYVIQFASLYANDTYEVEVKDVMLGDSNFSGEVTVADVVTTANYTVYGNENEIDYRFDFPNADVMGNDIIDTDDVTATVNIVLGIENPKNVRRQANVIATSDALVIDGFKVKGDSFIVPVNLDNTFAYAALQAVVEIPEGMTVKNVTLGERAQGHRLAYSIKDNGTVSLIIYSLSNASFAASEGSLFNLEVEAREDCGNIRINGIHASDARSNGYDLGFNGGQNETGTTGIDGINADEEGVRYFTVDGIEIFNPEKGQILIRVENGNATKVIK